MARLTDQIEKNEAPGPDFLVHVVDPDDTTNNPAGTSFKISVANLIGGFIASLGIYFNKSTDDTDDITEGVNKFISAAEKAKLAGIAAGATQNDTDANLRARAGHTGTQPASTISDFNTAADARVSAGIASHVGQADPHTQYQQESGKDVAGGYAGLDGNSKLNPSQLPAIAVTDTFVVASQVAMLALTAETGDVAVRTDLSKTFILKGTNPAVLGDWQELVTPTDQVQSVFGRTAVVTAQNGDYNTSQVTENTNLYFTVSRVLATVLTGFSTASTALVTASDTVLSALGKLQAQITKQIKMEAGATGIELYNTADQVTNVEKGTLSFVSNVLRLTSSVLGTGVVRALELIASGTNNNVRIKTDNNTLQLVEGGGGVAFMEFIRTASNATTAWFRTSGTSTASSGVNKFIEIANTVNQTLTAGYTALKINITETATGSGAKRLIEAQVGGVDKFVVDNLGGVTIAPQAVGVSPLQVTLNSNGTGFTVGTGDANGIAGVIAGTERYRFRGTELRTTLPIVFGSTGILGDTNLYRSAADTLKTDDNFIVGAPSNVAGSAVTVDGTQQLSNKTVVDEAYGVGWDSSLGIPSKNAVYDQMELRELLSNKSTDTNLGTSNTLYPTQNAVKIYVDAVAQGLSIKDSVRVATVAALPANTYNNGASGVGATLTAITPGVLTVDGVAVALNDRILVKNEVAGANNGIYICTTAGTAGVPYVLTRSINFDSSSEIAGAFTFVQEGATNVDSGFVATTNNPITIGTTSIAFTQFSGAGQITAGAGLIKNGNTLDVVVDDVSLEIVGDALQLKPGGHTHTASEITDFDEAAQDAVINIMNNNGGIEPIYDDVLNTLEFRITDGAVTAQKLQYSNGASIHLKPTPGAGTGVELDIPAGSVLGRGPTGDVIALLVGPGINITDTEISVSGGAWFDTQITVPPGVKNFGVFSYSEDISIPGILPANFIELCVAPHLDEDENNEQGLSIQTLTAIAGTDMFTVNVEFSELTTGIIKLKYKIN